jgi:hypothetical protein
MKTTKDGAIQYRKSALQKANDFCVKPFPLRIYRKGQKVQVFMGCGYSTAFVMESFQDRCVVRLSRTGRVVSVYDQRSIKEVSQELDSND